MPWSYKVSMDLRRRICVSNSVLTFQNTSGAQNALALWFVVNEQPAHRDGPDR